MVPPLPGELRLESDRVTLRDWRDEDAAAIGPVCGEWDVCAFTSVPWEWSEAAALAWIDRQRRKRAAGTVLALAIQAPDDERALGNVNLAGFADGGREAEIGYWLVPEARGRGLVTAATALLSDWGFRNLGLERVEFAILPTNLASQRVAERAGYRFETTLPRHCRYWLHDDPAADEWHDCLIWTSVGQ